MIGKLRTFIRFGSTGGLIEDIDPSLSSGRIVRLELKLSSNEASFQSKTISRFQTMAHWLRRRSNTRGPPRQEDHRRHGQQRGPDLEVNASLIAPRAKL